MSWFIQWLKNPRKYGRDLTASETEHFYFDGRTYEITPLNRHKTIREIVQEQRPEELLNDVWEPVEPTDA